MKNSGNTYPEEFEFKHWGDTAQITFRENIVSAQDPDTGETVYTWDEYSLLRPYRDMLETDILAVKDVWFEAAKMEEERSNPVDQHQLRADVDYLMIIQTAVMGISLMSLDAASDPTVLDLSWKYYPARWDETKLRTLVSMQKLTASDFQSITGKPYETEVIG